jgi:4-nitrophenyl phosphatase
VGRSPDHKLGYTKEIMEIKDTQALIIDMDGVLWRGNTFLPGVGSFFAYLRERSLPFILATNNSTVTPQGVADRLAQSDAKIFPEEVLTSSMATASYLQTRLSPGARIHPVGEPAVRDALRSAGFNLTDDTEDVDAVVVGFDRGITWKKLTQAALAIQKGALFVGTNPDKSFPIEQGQAPGNGAFVNLLEVTTRTQPLIIGKPEPLLYKQAAGLLGIESGKILVVGDRLETDILGAQHAGMASVLMLTGVTSTEQAVASDIKPDWILEDLHALIGALQGA